MIPELFSDAQVAELERNSQYRNSDPVCPTCHGANEYRFRGNTYQCECHPFYGHTQRRLFKLYCLANIPKEHMQLLWQDYPSLSVKTLVENYIGHWQSALDNGMGLGLYGSFGTGKTWAGVKVLKEMALQGNSCWFIPFHQLRANYRKEDDEQRFIKRKMLESQFLMIDDITEPLMGERQKHFYEDQLEEVIRTRAHMNFPTITTTNMSAQDLQDYYPRVATIFSGKQMVINLGGRDFRPQARETRLDIMERNEVIPIE